MGGGLWPGHMTCTLYPWSLELEVMLFSFGHVPGASVHPGLVLLYLPLHGHSLPLLGSV